MDTIAVSEGDELDRQLAQISQKTEVDEALEALKARLGEGPAKDTAAPAKQKEKVSSAFEE
jgi:phage shock protein A